MRQILGIFFCLTAATSGFTQTLNNPDRIIEVYGTTWYEQMTSANPDVLTFLDNYASFGFVVMEVVPDKLAGVKPLTSVPLRDKSGISVSVVEFMEAYESGTFNPLKYDFFPRNEAQYYYLDGTNYVIMILSQEEILKLANEH